jgi:predicted permease
VLNDLRQTLRSFRRAPVWALGAVSTLTLAIGVNAAVFSTVQRILLQPLPIADPDRVVVIWPRERANPTTTGEISYAIFRAWQEEARSFDRLAAMSSTNVSLILRETEGATVPVAAVSSSFFSVLGVSAPIGRVLETLDDQQGSAPVAVMNHDAWVRRFGADPGIVGRQLRFEDAAYTVVGVMPEGFDYPRGAELWVPLVPWLVKLSKYYETDVLTSPGFGVLFLVGRLEARTTLTAARAEVSKLIASAGPAFPPGREAVLTPVSEHIFGKTGPALVALAACGGLVFLVACSNVALLLFVRITMRARDTATRLALGATRWRIVRQSLTDALVLGGLAGVAGLGLTHWLVKVLVAMAPADVPRLGQVRFDAYTVAFACVSSLLTMALVGIVPGLQASRRARQDVLVTSGARIVRGHRVRGGFVIAQVGLALVLIVSAGLIVRSFRNLVQIDLGFNPDRVLTLDVTLPNASPERHNALYRALLTNIQAMPGVEATGAVYQRPLEHAGVGMDATILIEGQSLDLARREWELNPRVNYESVTPNYFRAIGTPIIKGRDFMDQDDRQAPRVAIVSERLANRLWPGQDAIGKRMLPPGPPGTKGPSWTTVVGVVGDARYRGLTDLRFDLYVPFEQIPHMPVKHLMVRTYGDPVALASAIRREAQRLESRVLVEHVSAMSDFVARGTAPWRFGAWTLSLLGFLALVLALSGVYAAISQSVVERTREIGVRIAMGARPVEIVRLVLREGMVLVSVGACLGLAVAASAGRTLGSLLYEVSSIDLPTLASAALLLLAVSTFAIVQPAWRASHVDPVVALRRE